MQNCNKVLQEDIKNWILQIDPESISSLVEETNELEQGETENNNTLN